MSNHVRRGACATTGKRCFDTRADAKHNNRQSHLKLSVYKCRDCGFFHQGGWHGTKDRAAHRGENGQPNRVDIDRLTQLTEEIART
jgi:hypothetical protein